MTLDRDAGVPYRGPDEQPMWPGGPRPWRPGAGELESAIVEEDLIPLEGYDRPRQHELAAEYDAGWDAGYRCATDIAKDARKGEQRRADKRNERRTTTFELLLVVAIILVLICLAIAITHTS